MICLKLRIQSLNDAAEGRPAVDGDPSTFVETHDITALIQEHGTVSGQTTMMFLLKAPDGTTHYAQITAEHFEALIGAFRGAQSRFFEEKKARLAGSH